MKLILTIIFFIAFRGQINDSRTTVYFLGKLLTWVVWKIKPESFKKEITNKDIFQYNMIMLFSILLWSIIFYNLI